MSKRGTTNSAVRSSSYARRARKAWLLSTFGTGEFALCAIGLNDICEGVVDAVTIQVDRVIPGALGGRYTRDNIRPACRPCNIIDGIQLREQLKLERSA